MNPPTLHHWPSRLQLVATGLLISAAESALFSDYPVYTYITLSIAVLLSIAAWILSKRQERAVADYQRSVRQEMQDRLRVRWESVPIEEEKQ